MVIYFSSASFASSDLCNDPEVVRQAAGIYCHSEAILYRANGSTVDSAFARVITGYKQNYDTSEAINVFFLRLPGDRIVKVEKFPYSNGFSERYIKAQLGFGPGDVAHNLLYDKVVEEIASKFCVIYRMKYPFTGEVQDCDGGHSAQGSVGYAQGVIAVRDAIRRICAHVEAETSRPCGDDGVHIISVSFARESGESMHYRFVSRRAVREFPELKETVGYHTTVPAEIDERTYRLDAKSSAISQLRQITMLCSFTCKPIAGRKYESKKNEP